MHVKRALYRAFFVPRKFNTQSLVYKIKLTHGFEHTEYHLCALKHISPQTNTQSKTNMAKLKTYANLKKGFKLDQSILISCIV
jgi:hypothetical protein